MLNAWIVVREEKHIDDKYWVCLDKIDALKIANDVTEYWKNQYRDGDIDEECYGDRIYHYKQEDAFAIHVQPQQIREVGENKSKEDV